MPGANGQKGPVPHNVAVSLAGGLETKVDPNQVSAPKCLLADNVRMTTTGAVRKRYGLTPLPPPQTASATLNVMQSNRDLLSTQSNRFYAYDPDNTAWRNIGELYPVGLDSTPITTLSFPPAAATTTVCSAPTWAIVGTTAILTYSIQVSSAVYVVLTCFDITTGAVYWTTQFNDLAYLLSSSYYNIGNGSTSSVTRSFTTLFSAPKIISYKNTFIWGCVQADGTNGYVRVFAIPGTQNSTTAPDLVGATNCTVLDGANTSFPTLYAPAPLPNFDMSANSTDFVLVAVGKNSGASAPSTVALRTNGTLPTATSIVTKASTSQTNAGPYYIKTSMADGVYVCFVTEPRGVSYVATQSGPVSGWGAATALSGYVQTLINPPASAPASSAGMSTPFTAIIRDDGTGTGHWKWTVTDGFLINSGTGDYTSAGSPTITATTYVNPVMTSMSTTDYSGTGSSSIASQIFLLNGVPHVWMVNGPGSDAFISYILINLTDSNIAAHTYYLRARVFNGGDNRAPQVHTINGVPSTLLVETFNQSYNFDLVEILPQQVKSILTPAGALIIGADTKYYDGQRLRTAGWLKPPEIGRLTLSAGSGGSLTPSTTYTYFFTNVDYDASGNAIISAPSPPYTITLGSSQNQVTLDLTSMQVDYPGPNGPQIEIYRNTAIDQLNYHLVTAVPANTGTTYIDKISDGNIAGNRYLYSPPSGGELPNDPAPPSTCGVSTKTKAFLASAEHGSWLYYSKPFFAGRAPEFNAGSFIDVEPATGDIVGLAALDEVVIIFKRKNIYLLSGTGPDATGAGSFSPITNISTDRGLVDVNSVVTTNDGVYFRTQRGIEIIDRGYAITYIGSPVEGIVNGTTVLSAVSAPEQSQVRFALSSGTSVVYDYSTAAWTTYTYAVNTQPAPLQVTSQVNFQGLNYAAMNTSINGVIYYEDASKFIDDAAPYPVNVQSAYTAMAGPQGWGRIRRANILGTCQSVGTNITVTFLYDYANDTQAAQTYTLNKVGAFNIRVRAPRQVCQAVAVKVTLSGTGEGVVLSDIVLETSAKSANLRVPDTRSI